MAHHTSLPIWHEKTDAQKINTLREMVDDLYHYTLGAVNARILAMVAAAQPEDDKEAESLRMMQTMIAAHPNIIAPNCEPGHLTGSALILDVTQGRVLLHLHKKLNLWLPMGGHAEYETAMWQVALREAHEESSLDDLRLYPSPQHTQPVDYDVHTIPKSHDRPEHLHLDFRYVLATSTPDAARMDTEESLGMQWLSFADVYGRADVMPDVKRLTRKAERLYRHHG
jgi:8-oxo-dGTP pyrophosphatase MutT (NUDIX family)